MRRLALEEHIGASTKSQPDFYFSIGLPAGSLRSLKKVLAVSEFAGGAFDSGEAGVSGARPEIHSASMLAGSEYLCHRSQQLVFFTVIESHISRAVRAKVSGQQKLSGVQVVSVHSLLNFRPSDKVCVASLSPMLSTSLQSLAAEAHAVMTLHPATLSTDSLLSMHCWEPSPDITLFLSSHCTVPDAFEQQMPYVLRVLSVAPDGAPDESFAEEGSRNLLAYLRATGYVVGPPWKFTVRGKENIACGANLVEKHRVCRRAPEGTNLSDMTLYELLAELDAQGFEHSEVEGRQNIRAAKERPYEPPDSEKVWYTRTGSSHCNCLYIISLLRAEEHGRPVPHFAPGPVYRALLCIKLVTRKRVYSGAGQAGPCPDYFAAHPRKARAPRKRVDKKGYDGDSSGDGTENDDDDGSDGSDNSSVCATDNGSEGDSFIQCATHCL